MKIDPLLNEYKKTTMFCEENNALTVAEMLDIIEKAIITSYPEAKQEFDFLQTVIMTAYKIGFVKGKRYMENTRKG